MEGAPMTRWIDRALFVLLLALAALLCGCASEQRSPRMKVELMKLRSDADAKALASARTVIAKILERTKAEYYDYAPHRRPDPPVSDILSISGGGDVGACGAGLLKAWKKV